MSRVVPYRDEFYELLDLKPEDDFGSLVVSDPQQRLKILGSTGNGFVLMHGGVILGVAGFMEMAKGVCEVWSMPSIYVDKYAFSYTRLLKKHLDRIFENFSYHRLQIITLKSDMYDRWASFLGFEKEGVLRQFSDTRRDYTIWSRVKICQ